MHDQLNGRPYHLVCAGLLAACCLPAATWAGKPVQPAPYTVIPFAGFGPDGGGDVEALSNPDPLGLVAVVGDSNSVDGISQAALWEVHPGSGTFNLTSLTPLGATEGEALDVNDAGWVVMRHSLFLDPFWEVVYSLWIPDVGIVNLPGFDGYSAHPRAISDTGYVVGQGYKDIEIIVDGEPSLVTEWHGILWVVDEQGVVEGPIDLGLFHPTEVNDNGLMIGRHQGVVRPAIATLDAEGNPDVVELSATGVGDALGLNNRGDVVGEIKLSSNVQQEAFLWSVETGMRLLGALGGGEESKAKDINEARQVVGISIGGQKGGTPGRGFLWQDGVMFDLNELIDTASEHQVWGAVGINDAGQIAAGLRVRLKGKGRELGTGQAALIIPTPSGN